MKGMFSHVEAKKEQNFIVFNVVVKLMPFNWSHCKNVDHSTLHQLQLDAYLGEGSNRT